MKAIQVKEYVKGPSNLTVTTLPDPTPKPNQYLIAIHASATNFFDLLQIRGKYQHQPPLPWVSGAEFSGVILQVPASLPNGKSPTFKKGDRVFGSAQGAYATKICAEEERLRPIPKDWGFFEAAGLMVTAPTSYAGLVTRAGVKKGMLIGPSLICSLPPISTYIKTLSNQPPSTQVTGSSSTQQQAA